MSDIPNDTWKQKKPDGEMFFLECSVSSVNIVTAQLRKRGIRVSVLATH